MNISAELHYAMSRHNGSYTHTNETTAKSAASEYAQTDKIILKHFEKC